MKLLKSILAGGLLVFSLSCNDDDPGDDNGYQQPGENEVVMRNNEFVPGQKTIDSGTTITWTNEDTVVHTVTSNEGLFDENVNPGETFSYTFNSSGTFDYICTIHSGMSGTIVVQASGL